MERQEVTRPAETAEPVREYKYHIQVQFRPGEKAYTFGTDDEEITKGDKVVVETVRGMEIGTCTEAHKEAVSSNGMTVKPILRIAGKRDIEMAQRNREDEKEAMVKCRDAIDRLGLPMNLTSAEYTLDRARLVFTYVADERVDFRELLRILASTFHTRIELRQIGPRDKAKMVGGIGICGMQLCCNRFQHEFNIISINMAKNQLLALNPEKLSGTCGKLMCCLAYENEAYKELRQGLPKMNASIIYENKRYRITSMNVLDQSCRLSGNEGVVDMTLDELKALVAYNEEHDINTQNFIKEQREREKYLLEHPEEAAALARKAPRKPTVVRTAALGKQKKENEEEKTPSTTASTPVVSAKRVHRATGTLADIMGTNTSEEPAAEKEDKKPSNNNRRQANNRGGNRQGQSRINRNNRQEKPAEKKNVQFAAKRTNRTTEESGGENKKPAGAMAGSRQNRNRPNNNNHNRPRKERKEHAEAEKLSDRTERPVSGGDTDR